MHGIFGYHRETLATAESIQYLRHMIRLQPFFFFSSLVSIEKCFRLWFEWPFFHAWSHSLPTWASYTSSIPIIYRFGRKIQSPIQPKASNSNRPFAIVVTKSRSAEITVMQSDNFISLFSFPWICIFSIDVEWDSHAHLCLRLRRYLSINISQCTLV